MAVSNEGPPSFILYGPTGVRISDALFAFQHYGFMAIGGVPFGDLEKQLASGEQSGKPLAIHPDLDPYAVSPEQALSTLEALKNTHGDAVKTLYLSMATDKLIQAFSDNAPKHPYERSDLREAIEQEQLLYRGLKKAADYHIDMGITTRQELTMKVAKVLGITTETPPLEINLLSFGFKHGVPTEADLVFDVRFLPNPFYDETLRPFTGLDKPVADYVMGFPETQTFMTHWKNLLVHVLPLYQNQGKLRITIGIGCTGGQHRSVAMTAALANDLKTAFPNFPVRTKHREQSHWPEHSQKLYS